MLHINNVKPVMGSTLFQTSDALGIDAPQVAPVDGLRHRGHGLPDHISDMTEVVCPSALRSTVPCKSCTGQETGFKLCI